MLLPRCTHSAVHDRPSVVQLVELERFVQAVLVMLVSQAWHSFVGFHVPLL